MKKTRFFALILALVMAVTMFAGCGGGGDTESSDVSSYEYSMPSVPATTVKKAEKWTAEHAAVEGWAFSNNAEYVFNASQEVDNDIVAYLQFVEKLTDGRTLDDVIKEYIDDCKTNALYNSQEWIIETPEKVTFGGKESYKIAVNYAIQIRAPRHYTLIFTQLDDEVFVFNSNYTIREDSDETLINNLMNAITYVPMA